jgi:hypothetical protein
MKLLREKHKLKTNWKRIPETSLMDAANKIRYKEEALT